MHTDNECCMLCWSLNSFYLEMKYQVNIYVALFYSLRLLKKVRVLRTNNKRIKRAFETIFLYIIKTKGTKY